jgi:hypothetical protein
MTAARFDSARQHMLAQWRDWVARGGDAAEFYAEVEATASAMRQILELRNARAQDVRRAAE